MSGPFLNETRGGLSAEQAEVVSLVDQPVLVQAGPGSGKTRTLVEKFVRLVSQGTAPERVLCLTFSKKAATEMQRRIQTATRRSVSRLWVSTFHSFGHALIQQFPVEAGVPRTFRLLTGFKEWVLVREVLRSAPLKGPLAAVRDHRGLVGEVANALSTLKQNLIGPRELGVAIERSSDGSGTLEDLLVAYQAYESELRARRHIDFRDLITVAKGLLESSVQIRARVQGWFDAILLDELQDVDRAQLGLIGVLVAGSPLARRITAVGDTDQSIYRFRGALPDEIRSQFVTLIEGVVEKRLTSNFRSMHPVVQLGQRALGVEPKTEPDDRLRSPLIEVHAADTGLAEATAIARELRKLRRSTRLRGEGTYRWRDMAVLCRSVRRDGKVIESELERLGIPYRVHGNASFYRNPAVAFLVNYIFAITDENNDAPFRRVLASPVPALPEAPLARFLDRVSYRDRHAGRYFWFLRFLMERENKERFPVYRPDRADEAEADAELTAERHEHAKARPPYFFSMMSVEDKQVFYDFHQRYLLLRARARRAKDGLPALVSMIATKSGLIDWILRVEKDDPRTAARHAANISKLQSMISDYTEIAVSAGTTPGLDDLAAHLRELVEHFANESEVDPPNDDLGEPEDSVSVMTVHQAKGLEFEVIFVPHLVTGKFPVPPRPQVVLSAAVSGALSAVRPEFRDESNPDVLAHSQDERRLFYVAVTRARERVFLSWAKRYDGDEDVSSPSPFLIEALGGSEIGIWRSAEENSESHAAALARVAQSSRSPVVRCRSSGDGSVSLDEATTRDELEIALRRLHSRGDDWARKAIEEALRTTSGVDKEFVVSLDPFPRDPDRPLALDPTKLELSASRLDEHSACPRKFFYAKLLHVARPSGPQAQFGTAVHAALEDFHKAHSDLHVVVDQAHRVRLGAELRERFDAALFAVRESFTTEFEFRRYLASARAMVEPYMAMLAQEPLRHVAGRELDLRFEAGGAHLIAKIDRISADAATLEGAREVMISDYKTVREATTRALTLKKRIMDGSEIQLVTYFQAFKKQFGISPSYLGKVFLRHTSEWRAGTLHVLLKVQGEVPPKDSDFTGRSGRLQTDRAWISENDLDAAWSGITARICSIMRPDVTRFEITPSKASCLYCPYSTICGREDVADVANF